MIIGIYIGRFQPFHKGHFKTLINYFENCDKIIIVPIYYEKNGKEILSQKNPIPIKLRINYIRSIINDYPFLRNKCHIIPQNILDINFLKNIQYLILSSCKTSENSKNSVIIFTRDLSRKLIYSLYFFTFNFFGINVKVIYDKERSISSSMIREAIRKDNYENIRELLVKDLDIKTIYYIKKTCGYKDLNILPISFY
ncbi:MAG: adenylyltransferase/cytidyltransferase family protein [Candidatus Aenigmatarchaeota archaeon]